MIDNFLRKELEKFFIKLDEKKDSCDDFSLETPPIELEAIAPIHFITKPVLNKVKKLIMPEDIIGRVTFSESLEVINNIKPFKIRYKRLETRKTSCYDRFKYKITMSAAFAAPTSRIKTNLNLKKTGSFKNLNLYDKKEFNILIGSKDEILKEFKNYIIKGPNLEKGAFWIELMPVNLNSIAPKFVKNISYRSNNNNSLLLRNKEIFESLREVEIQPAFTLFTCDLIEEEKDGFQKKCIVNVGTLQNDLLIESLQSSKWKIYERPESFKGIQMIQVSPSSILFLIRIESLKRSIDIVKRAKQAKVIIELENSK